MQDIPQPPTPTAKPVRLPASATLTLPRWGILLLCLLYILPGLIGRDPWKNSDAADFGVMWTMAKHGGLNWIWPNIDGLQITHSGPLTYWPGAICIRLFGSIVGAPFAARIATLLFFMLGAYAIWHTAYILGRRESAQPMRLAFGGQPEVLAYGRVLADGALLIYLGSLGLIVHSHETSIGALFVVLIACTLYRCTCYIEKPTIVNALLVGLTLGALSLTNGIVFPIALSICFLAGLFFYHGSKKQFMGGFLLAIALASTIVLIWCYVANTYSPYPTSAVDGWMQWQRAQLGFPTLDSIFGLFKKGVWFFWPAWPYACWAIYAWRKQWTSAHVILPLLFTITFIFLAICNINGPKETFLLAFLPPLAILAALGLPTMKRGAINAIDWFAVMTLSLIAVFIWLAWFARHTGWPAGLARNATKLAPGFLPEFSFIATAIAVCATLAWFALVYWRISRQPHVLWRAVVLSTGGLILCWLLLATLWLPWINYSKSYAGIATEMSRYMSDATESDCIKTNVTQAQRASFAYFGQVHFSSPNETVCRYELIGDRVPKYHRPISPKRYKGMTLIWEGHRPSDKSERFRLYQRY